MYFLVFDQTEPPIFRKKSFKNQNPLSHTLLYYDMQRVLPNLPYEIIYNILSRLPVKPLCRFKSVSKSWLALITDPHFIKSLRDHRMNDKLILYFPTSPSLYSMDFQSPDPTVAEFERTCKYSRAKILGSFNGIILLGIGDILCLWNPCIRTYREFSQPECPEEVTTIYGLCYDSVSDDFKVVRISMSVTADPYAVHVFSSTLNSWKKVGDFDYYLDSSKLGTVLNGAPHWIVMDNNFLDFNFTRMIVCFDATVEEFKEVPKPNYESMNELVVVDLEDLAVLGGLICVVMSNRENPTDVWVMKEYGVRESWTKLFVIPHKLGDLYFPHFEMLCYTKDGEVVMLLNVEKLGIYNPKEETFKWVEITLDSKWFYAAFYTESLVSPRCCSGEAPLIR